jgi:hypothetical protein
MTCRSFDVASGRFVEYFLLLSFWRSVKNSNVLTSMNCRNFFQRYPRVAPGRPHVRLAKAEGPLGQKLATPRAILRDGLDLA